MAETKKYVKTVQWKADGLNSAWVVFTLQELRRCAVVGVAALAGAPGAIRTVGVHANFDVITDGGGLGNVVDLKTLTPWDVETAESLKAAVCGLTDPADLDFEHYPGVRGETVVFGDSRSAGWVELQFYEKYGDAEGFAALEGVTPDQLLGMEDADVERRTAQAAGAV